MKKKGAIELSIGTIVIIVLAMSMLILGLVLVKNIFGGATNLVDLNNQQITEEISKIYGADQKVVMYPNEELKLKQGEDAAFAIRIRNTVKGAEGQGATFSYSLKLEGLDECGLSEEEVFSWMIGESGADIAIPSSEGHVEKILVDVPEGSPICNFKTRVTVTKTIDSEETNYGAAQIFLKIK